LQLPLFQTGTSALAVGDAPTLHRGILPDFLVTFLSAFEVCPKEDFPTNVRHTLAATQTPDINIAVIALDDD
jgi:hypothetical protein